MTKNEKETESPPKRKSRRKRLLIWLAIDIIAAVVIMSLLLNSPAGYKPSQIDPETYEPGQIHPYLTQLSADYYNGAQRQEPFDFVVDQQKFNDALADWTEQSQDVSLYWPMVRFTGGVAIFMATADFKGVDLIVTIAVRPAIDASGMLGLDVSKVKVGSMGLTPLARFTAAQMYQQRIADGDVDAEHWRTKIAAALLSSEPFEPVFPAEDKRVRAVAISADKGKLTIRFAPAP